MKALAKIIGVVAIAMAIGHLGGSCASAPEPEYAGEESSLIEPPPGAKYHLIQRGENLYRISLKYGVGVEEIKRFNNIWDVHDIKTGTRIYIPPHAEIKPGGLGKRWYKATQAVSEYGPMKTSVRFVWPVRHVDLSSPFGIRNDGKHTGVDLRNPEGTPIYAAAGGKVIFSGDGPSGYGNTIMIKHDAGTITVYAHNENNMVTDNEDVKQGQQVATVGRTGRATGYHVHFEVRINRKPVDPEKYLPRAN